MDFFIKFVNDKITPIANKISRNVWVASLQEAILGVMPLILVGSVISVLSILNEFFTWFPDLSPINSFSFGLVGIAVAFVFPVNALKKFKLTGKENIAGITNACLYLMLVNPEFTDAGEWIFKGENLGSSGMFLGIISGIFTSLIFVAFGKMSIFKDPDTLPDYVVSAFDSFLPSFVVLLIGFIITYVFNINFMEILTWILTPLTFFGQSYAGFLIYIFGTVLLYSFGISPWILYGLFYPIMSDAVTANAAQVAAGQVATNINALGVADLAIPGGMGATLMLTVLLLRAKSTRLKTMGKVGIVPAIFNINEPIVFGTPIILNPLLMIPFWLNGFINATIVYFTFYFGLVTLPTQPFGLWFTPFPFLGYFATHDWRSIILSIVVLIVSALIYYPFVKAYDAQEVKKEAEALEEEHKERVTA